MNENKISRVLAGARALCALTTLLMAGVFLTAYARPEKMACIRINPWGEADVELVLVVLVFMPAALVVLAGAYKTLQTT